jgi:uncharacterized protein (TIGR03435 family)
MAYGVRNFQISGPAWIDSDRYDISAKAEGNPTLPQELLMLQALLGERFRLVLHRETREAPIYDLIVAKSGLSSRRRKGTVASLSNRTERHRKPNPARLRVFAAILKLDEVRSMSGVGRYLPCQPSCRIYILDRPVADKTGLTGTFDVHLEFSPDQATAQAPGQQAEGDPATAVESRPSIFTALQEQLGLGLEPARGPVELLVIDHVEKSSEN